ncbi:hypothetical protein QJS10_CPB15g00863 [Acorus calamus]|uniref:Uncharacterized protein n=1 Tax=Acorus calamus TaxID=4465 RepID=A0AAV9D611_ACOCL|nr:hypothetical protein QJS10_CPB15g00863 [Acorus calamus]
MDPKKCVRPIASIRKSKSKDAPSSYQYIVEDLQEEEVVVDANEEDSDIDAASMKGHFQDLNKVRDHAWGAAALVHLYRQLGIASSAKCRQISGYHTLLQRIAIAEYLQPLVQGRYALGILQRHMQNVIDYCQDSSPLPASNASNTKTGIRLRRSKRRNDHSSQD